MDFESLRKDILSCTECKEKFGFTPHPIVFGNKNAKIVQISQAPSKKVYETLKPFNDLSGKKLKYDWYEITDEEFYNPNNFYIVSLAHCYPGKDKNGKDNAPPKNCYEKWVKKELSFIDNKIYIFVGAMAANVFFPNEKFKDLVFKNNVYNGKLALVLPHPSPLNFKWLKDNPQFMKTRIIKIRKIIKNILKK